jgi:hypothetical protein
MLLVVIIGVVIALAPLACPAHAQQHSTTFEQVTVANTAIGITAAITSGMAGCGVRLETAQVRWRVDASPTSSVGTLLEVGDTITFTRIEDAQRVKFIRTGTTSGLLDVWCWSQS